MKAGTVYSSTGAVHTAILSQALPAVRGRGKREGLTVVGLGPYEAGAGRAWSGKPASFLCRQPGEGDAAGEGAGGRQQ